MRTFGKTLKLPFRTVVNTQCVATAQLPIRYFGKYHDSDPATCPMCRQQVKQWSTSVHLKFYRSHGDSQFRVNVSPEDLTTEPRCNQVSQYFLNNKCVRDSAIIKIAFMTTQMFQDLNEEDPKTMLSDLLNRWEEVHHVFATQETEQLNLDKITYYHRI